MKRTFTRGFVLSTFIFLVPFSFVFAAGSTATSTGVTLALPNDCSLTNANVSVTLNKGTTQVTAGNSVNISGTITNKNSYPIPDVSIVVRLVKFAKKLGSPYDVATDTVSRVVSLSGLYLAQSSTANFSLTLHTSSSLLTGPYFAEIFLNGSDQFAVGGNEYLGIPSAIYPLAISGSQKQTSFLDVDTLKVNGVKPLAQMLSTLSGVKSATTTMTVVSTYVTPRNTTISWYLYSGNFVNDNNLVATKTESVRLLPSSKTTVSFASSDFVHSKYLLVGELQDGDKKSFISDRITRSDIVEPSTRSLYLTSFPISSGTNFVRGCLTENFSNVATTTNISLFLTNTAGSVVWSGNFSRSSSTPVFQFQLPFTLSSSTKQSLNLTLKTSDVSGGNSKMLSSVSYVCDSMSCPVASTVTAATTNIPSYVPYVLIMVIVLIIVILVLLILFSKKRKSSPISPMSPVSPTPPLKPMSPIYPSSPVAPIPPPISPVFPPQTPPAPPRDQIL